MSEELRAKIARRGELINELNLWRSSIGGVLIEKFKEEKDIDKLYDIANDLYWQDVELSSINASIKGAIKDAFLGVTGIRFKPQKILDINCPACGEQIKVSSGEKLKSVTAEGWQLELNIAQACCQDCWNLQLEKKHRPDNIIVYPNPNIHNNIKADYQLFLTSEYWMQIREYIKQRDGGECVLCGSRENLHVHHKNYYHRGYEFKSDLHTLCGKCHRKYHGVNGQ